MPPRKPKHLHKPPGRPTVMTPEVIGKLEEAYSWGCTDVEACLHANINPDTLYEYCKREPSFTERKERLKRSPELAAKKMLAKDAAENSSTAKWLLERKQRDEYGDTKRVTHDGSLSVDHFISAAMQTVLDSVIGTDDGDKESGK